MIQVHRKRDQKSSEFSGLFFFSFDSKSIYKNEHTFGIEFVKNKQTFDKSNLIPFYSTENVLIYKYKENMFEMFGCKKNFSGGKNYVDRR